MYSAKLKNKAKSLRRKGFKYIEIQDHLSCFVPKSTLSTWCRNEPLTPEILAKKRVKNQEDLRKAREKAAEKKKEQREAYFTSLRDENIQLTPLLFEKDVMKVALAMLYLGEGAKSRNRAAVMFGNSDPSTIILFLKLFRQYYPIDEKKFRCTVQCRADQDVDELEKFWAKTTNIPLSQFYSARIDQRTKGKLTKKADYKGVCRVDYFSAHTYWDIISAIDVIKGS